QADRANFFRAQIIFWILAATDGHAKNFSIAHLPGNRYHLTPLYDVLSAWPVIGPGNNQIAWQKCKLAMAVRGSSNYYHLSQIRRRHWLRQGELAGLSAAQVNDMIDALTASAPAVIARVADALPVDFPASLADVIFNGMHQQCARLAAA
ncbi:HipA domain-containing protein, partial [Cronobacter sakazakii]|nr:HipA domain-containing protein [Cronobacter sakazakii]